LGEITSPVASQLKQASSSAGLGMPEPLFQQKTESTLFIDFIDPGLLGLRRRLISLQRCRQIISQPDCVLQTHGKTERPPAFVRLRPKSEKDDRGRSGLLGIRQCGCFQPNNSTIGKVP